METRKVLAVIDVQNDFITGSLRNEEAIKKVPNIVNKIRNFNGDAIFYTMDTHSENYLSTKEGEKLPVVHCVKGTEGWEIEPNVKAALEDAKLRNIKVVCVEKPTFGSYDLVEEIKRVSLWTNLDIEFVGFCTDICVVSNALLLKAYFYDIADITVDAKCCACVSDKTHDAALTTMETCQINVINRL
jgi:nicotinamidase-related amidase